MAYPNPPPPLPPARRKDDSSRDDRATTTRSSLLPAYGFWHWLAAFLLLGAFGWFYVATAEKLIEQTNEDPLRSDQKHNMKLALKARDFHAIDSAAGSRSDVPARMDAGGRSDSSTPQAGAPSSAEASAEPGEGIEAGTAAEATPAPSADAAVPAETDAVDDAEMRPFSRALWEWFPHYTDGVVNPLWPWAAAWVAPEGMTASPPDEVNETDVEFFRRGKWLNVTLTGLFLLLMGMTLARSYSLLGMINLVLLAGLGAFLPRSVYFQPEPLYYLFFFLSWVTAIAILKENRLWLYPVLGLVAGLAYLAKTSIEPLLVVFLLVSTYRFIAALFPRLLGIADSERAAGTWSCRNHFVGMVILVFAYLATTGPRLDFAQRQFGDPFHSYPKYWMWMDDFPTGYAWMGEHPGREELEAIPPEELPSLQTYLADHTGKEMIDRLRGGLDYVVVRFFEPPRRKQDWDDPKPWKFLLNHRGHYLAWLAFVLFVMAILYTRHREKSVFPSQRIQPAAIPIILFVVGTFAAYALAYAWYVPIGKGDRFMLSLYAPLAASLIAGSESILLRVRRRAECLWIVRVYGWLQFALLAAIGYRIYELVRIPLFEFE